MTRRTVRPGELLVQEGDTVDHVFNLVAGVLKIHKDMLDGRSQITGFIYPGDFLGWSLFLPAWPVTAEAVSEATLCSFRREPFRRLLKAHPDVQTSVLELSCDEVSTAQDRMLLLGRKSAREKLATFLTHLHHRAQRQGPTSAIILPMKRSDIADYLGLTPETVSRAFAWLAENRMLTLDGTKTVTLLDLPALRTLAGEAAPLQPMKQAV
ncbi:MAG: Crp/Fnr family transcriptional regulator [Alphaproteobacteria bacterium]